MLFTFAVSSQPATVYRGLVGRRSHLSRDLLRRLLLVLLQPLLLRDLGKQLLGSSPWFITRFPEACSGLQLQRFLHSSILTGVQYNGAAQQTIYFVTHNTYYTIRCTITTIRFSTILLHTIIVYRTSCKSLSQHVCIYIYMYMYRERYICNLQHV